MNPYEFLPSYPDIDPFAIMNYYNQDDFNKIIYKNKELYDLTLSSDPFETLPNDYALKHQRLIARFLSSNSLYDEIFLFHSPGTGKTCSAIISIHSILNNTNLNIKGALILLKNDELKNQFKASIALCLGGEIEIANRFRFSTFQTFYNEYNNISMDALATKFSNVVIVMDEVHTIIHSQTYNFYVQFLHAIQNRKIILMTGTPMVNDVSDISLIMNLILPKELFLETNLNAFSSSFFTSDYSLQNEDILKNAFRGRISYLRLRVNIPLEFKGKQTKYFSEPLVISSMHSHQKNAYNIIQKQKQTFYDKERDASLFVFPDGSFGSVGFNRYVVKEKARFMLGTKFRYTAQFLALPKGADPLLHIYQYSCKYASIIQDIVNHPNQNVFVYLPSITGSGAIILGLCLELFKYSRVTNAKECAGKTKRYAILSGETETDWSNISNVFNDSKNASGEYIQVLIGGEQVKEGVTFKNIQRFHVAQAPWNNAELDQAIARGHRLGAHSDLPINTPISVFLHATDIGVDTRIYSQAFEKDYKIKQIEYVIKKESFDCPLTYERNKSKNKNDDGKRSCDYHDCLYSCSTLGNPPYNNLTLSDLNTDNYTNYFYKEYESVIREYIDSHFAKECSLNMSSESFLQDLKQMNVTLNQFYKVVHYMISNYIQVKTKDNLLAYLQEHSNFLFTTFEWKPSGGEMSLYVSQPVILNPNPRRSWPEQIVDLVKRTAMISSEEAKEAILNLPFLIQEQYIENALISDRTTPMVEWIKTHFKAYISYDPLRSTLIPGTPRVFINQQWQNETLEEKAECVQQVNIGGPKIYGIYREKGKKFAIIDAREIEHTTLDELKRKKKGQVCSTIHKQLLVNFLVYLNVPITDSLPDLPKAKVILLANGIRPEKVNVDIQKVAYWSEQSSGMLCQTLQDFLMQNNLIIP
jgi:hypothetical protein